MAVPVTGWTSMGQRRRPATDFRRQGKGANRELCRKSGGRAERMESGSISLPQTRREESLRPVRKEKVSIVANTQNKKVIDAILSSSGSETSAAKPKTAASGCSHRQRWSRCTRVWPSLHKKTPSNITKDTQNEKILQSVRPGSALSAERHKSHRTGLETRQHRSRKPRTTDSGL